MAAPCFACRRADAAVSSRDSYTVTHWEPPNKVVVTGDSSSVAALDTIEFSDAADGHTKIEYTVRRCAFSARPASGSDAQPQADIRLKGFLSLFTFLVASDIRALGDAAKDGLSRAFAEGRHERKA